MGDDLRLTPAPFSSCRAHRVCLIKPSSLGDVVQTLPVLHALRYRFPHAHIAWIVNQSYAPLLEPVSILDEVIVFDRGAYSKNPIRAWKQFREFRRQLRLHEFDLCIDLQGLLRSGLMAHATRANWRVGLSSAREGAAVFYTSLIDDQSGLQTAVDRYWQVAHWLGVGHCDKRFPLELSDEEKAWARQQLGTVKPPYLAVNPGARWLTKRWPAEHFAETVNRLSEQRQLSVVLTGGPDERDVSDAVARLLTTDHVNLCGHTNLRQLAALVDACDMMLTNDTGPMHLAGAVGTATVSLFTCTDPGRAGPFGEGHRVVQTEVDCRASYVKTCSRMDCMRELTPQRVLPQLQQGLDVIDDSHACGDCSQAA